MYKMEGTVRYSECGPDNLLKISSIVNYFQDCTTFHSESIGLGVEYCGEKKRAWFLSSWQIIIDRYPTLAEEVSVHTWATSFKGMMGDRNFCIRDQEGNKIARANSLWVYMDLEKGRPAKPDSEDSAKYGLGEPQDMENMSRKIELPEHAVEKEAVLVRKYHMDTNGHMNNCHYVQIALDALEEDIAVSQLRVEYKKSAVYNDIIIPKVAKEEDRTVVVLCDEEGKEFAVVELK
jgi:acyl-ACP thioesterase